MPNFSECEISMMDEVLAKYGNMTATELVAETHQKGSLWYQTASRTGLLEAFKERECNNSNEQIDLPTQCLSALRPIIGKA